MVNRKSALRIRKAHRYLGLFLGIQFLMWTISGLYFSWTAIEEIHGDHFKKLPPETAAFSDLIGSSQLEVSGAVSSLELIEIANQPYYWVNETALYNARSGAIKENVTQEEALQVAARHMLTDLKVKSIVELKSVGPHHEYRGRPLPAYEITYSTDEQLKAYVSKAKGEFQTVRHRNWRWFDFLWMTHTMDYQGRDNFNTTLLRLFSLLGLITVLSGFTLWAASSPSLRKLIGQSKR